MSPRKPRKEENPLSRERVVAEALRIVDEDGLDALTMRALGKRLDVDPMAIYYHIPNKDALLDGIVEAVWSELSLPPPPQNTDYQDAPDAPSWQDELWQIAYTMRDTLHRHPKALPVLATRPNVSRPGFRLTDRALGAVLRSGLPVEDAFLIVNAAAQYILGHVLAEVQSVAEDDDERIRAAFHQATADPEEGSRSPYPNLEHAFRSGLELREITTERIFESGLRTILRGLEARIREFEQQGISE